MEKIKNQIEKNPEMAKFTEKLRVTLQGKYKSHVKIGKHELYMDVPESMGGEDSGYPPTELLLASIAGCELGLCYSEAKRMNLSIEKVSMVISGMLDIRGFMGLADVPVGFQTIDIKLKIKSPEPTEKIDMLIEHVHKKCPVINTIKTPPELKLSLKHIKS